ncbi:MAG: pitrilysin family protein [Candidatus Sumerlaeia bacterium]|nr:pitrilysin family protein [Candidatus Sumerlaeia bacterium]
MTVHRLGNNLTVVLVPNPALPLVTADAWFRVGAGDEPRHLAGVSHYLEHMLFKGTAHLGPGEYDRRIEALGGYLNAATSFDYTHYYIELPSEGLRRGLDDFADVLRNSSITPHEVDSERKVILEEIARKNDDPTGFLYDKVRTEAMRAGAYSHPVIGFEESVAALTRDQLADHYERFYAPENTTLVLAGAFDRGSALASVEEAFGGWSRPLRPHRTAAPASDFTQPARRHYERPWSDLYFALTFPAPAVRTVEEEAAADLAGTVLGSSRTTRLVARLREQDRLVSSISAWVPTNREPSLAYIGGRCAAKNFGAALDGAFEEVAALLRDGFRPGELGRARRTLATSHLLARETNSATASIIGHSRVLYGNDDGFARYAEALRACPPEAVLAQIGAVFRREAASVFTTGPEAPPDA